MAIELAVRPMLAGQPVGYFVPTYKLLLEYWRGVCAVLAPVAKRIAQAERRIELVTGGILECWTLEDTNAGRSRKYKRAIIDEAGIVANLGDTWDAAIRPTLADLGGDAWFLGTPKGRNFFWEVFQRGLDPLRTEWQAWHMPTSANPYIRPSEIEDMRAELTERRFQQEIEAQFLDDAGGVFRNVRASATAAPEDPHDGHQYVIGADWGKSDDYTVFAVFDVRERAMVALERSNRVEYATQRARLMALCERYHPTSIIAESNSMGEPIIEQLQRDGLPVRPFITTNATKAAIIDGLALALEQRSIRLMDDPVLIAELEAFEATRLPSGMMRYSAPEGLHDDTAAP